MGFLQAFNLNQYDCTVFFETGTGKGVSLGYALQNSQFTKVFSTEIHQETAEKAIQAFKGDDRVSILIMESRAALLQILPTISQEDRVLFFLDAHFPGELSADFKGYKAEEALATKLPLEEELRLIREWRPQSRDVIIIDDLRIYENGPFEAGNMPDWAENFDQSQKNIDFIIKLFADCRISRDYRNEGYLVITPAA